MIFDECFDRLMTVGGFPEPFLKGTQTFYNRWKRSHIDMIMREDLVTLSAVRDIHSIETLIELLRSRVGSPISANSLAGDLQRGRYTRFQSTVAGAKQNKLFRLEHALKGDWADHRECHTE